jgi:hypothetical protein
MPRDKQTNVSQFLFLLCIISMTVIYIPIQAELTSLARNDAYPVFTTLNLDDALLLTAEQLRYKEIDWAEKKKSRVQISISPFGQNADRGKTERGELFPLVPQNNFDPGTGPQTYNTTPIIVPLGDITGRVGMIALTYGDLPDGVASLPPALELAKNQLFVPNGGPGGGTTPPQTEAQIDPDQLFGYFSNILKYRKRGVRFQLAARVYKDFGLKIQAGISTIRQVLENRVDMTSLKTLDPDQTFEGLDPETVDNFLMDEVNTIARQSGLEIGDSLQTSAEEFRFGLFWRHAFELNRDTDNKWAYFLLIPYAELAGSVSPGKKRNVRNIFSVPCGNNTHSSFGFTLGMNFDFIETIEIGGEVGFTKFFKKGFDCYPIPNSPFQTTMFPFTTNVHITPGHNWHFLARIAAYHFVDNLSMQFEWVVLDHKEDSITLDTPDPAFLPCILEKRSSFKTKLGNAGFNYDIAPNIGIGFLWQIPFSQRNSYRSSTLMGGINITF